MSRQKNNRLRSLFTFSKSERRGILWLLPLLAVATVIIVTANRPSFEKSFLKLADKESDYPAARQKDAAEVTPGGQDMGGGGDSAILFSFDPNTVTLQELCRLGFSARTSAGIIKYRERGKRFEIPEDFATCYGVSIGDYTRLEPYIVIGERFKVKKNHYGHADEARRDAGEERKPLAVFDPNLLDIDGFTGLGFSPAQAGAIVNYRESMGGFRSADDLARCYVVSEKKMEELRPYIDIAAYGETGRPRDLFADPLELNTADSVSLRSVSGIGGVLVSRIMDYRHRLGGFARVEQLAEIPGVTEANYERICKQIWVDSCEIQKIDINFATHKTVLERLGNHPYITPKVLRKLLKQRQLKGGWSNHGDMVRQNIMTKEEAERIAPYLIFVTQQQR